MLLNLTSLFLSKIDVGYVYDEPGKFTQDILQKFYSLF